MRSHPKALFGLIASAVLLFGCARTDSVRIVSEVNGRVAAVLVQQGAQVHTGDVLLQLDAHELTTRRERLITTIDATELRGTGALSLYRQLEQVKRELTRLTISAPSDGEIAWITPHHPGETISCGQTVALLVRK
jgi:multidrug resistance efflux pump